MLILPDGYKRWNKKIELFSPGEIKNDEKPWYEDGKVDPATIDTPRDGNVQPPDGGWVLPKMFCPACGKKDYLLEEGEEPSPGMYTFDEAVPGLQVTPNSVVIYWCCPECTNLFTKADQAMRRAAEMAKTDVEQLWHEEREKTVIISMPNQRAHQIYLQQKLQDKFDKKLEERLMKDKRAVDAAKRQAGIHERIVDWIRSQRPEDRVEVQR